MILSIYGFNGMIDHQNARFDPARLAHGVISGIGFLGAGVIIRRSDRKISGVTTAATLWVVAAIGLCVGSGFYTPAYVATGIVLVNAFFLRAIESKFFYTSGYVSVQISYNERENPFVKINNLLEDYGMIMEEVKILEYTEREKKRLLYIKVFIKHKKRGKIERFVKSLNSLDGFKVIDCSEKKVMFLTEVNDKNFYANL